MTTQLRSPRNTHKLSAEELKKMIEKDHKMVKGKFICFEPRGGSMSFSFKKYPGDQVLFYTMKDGEVRTVPLMVAKHLNNDCNYPVHSHVLDANGNPSVQVGRKVKRCSFESLEFSEEDEE